MKRQSIAILMFVASMSCAYAQESVPLCTAPLDPDCVDPKWGQIEPELDGGSPPSGNSAIAPRIRVSSIKMAIRSVASTSPSSMSLPATLRATVEATKLFVSQTRRLTSAIKRARFDKSGHIVRGAEEIEAAAAAAREPASGYALTLYIKAPAKLPDVHRELLNTKVAAINAALSKSSDQRDPPKPKS